MSDKLMTQNITCGWRDCQGQALAIRIIFTTIGLTGKEDNWSNSYGLIRVFNMIEKYRNNRNFNSIKFNLNDYGKIASGTSFLI